MRKIKIEIEVNEREYQLLAMAKSERPNADRIKLLLLTQAAGLVRRMVNDVLSQHGPLAGKRPSSVFDTPEGKRLLAEAPPLDAGLQPTWLDDENVRKLRED